MVVGGRTAAVVDEILALYDGGFDQVAMDDAVHWDQMQVAEQYVFIRNSFMHPGEKQKLVAGDGGHLVGHEIPTGEIPTRISVADFAYQTNQT